MQCLIWQKRKLNLFQIFTCKYSLKKVWESYSFISNRYSKVNNKYLKSYEPKQELKHIIYINVNYLYGYIMSTFLPATGCKWLDPKKFDLNKYPSNSSKGCVLKVNLEYPKELGEIHKNYPLAPDIIKREMLSDCN